LAHQRERAVGASNKLRSRNATAGSERAVDGLLGDSKSDGAIRLVLPKEAIHQEPALFLRHNFAAIQARVAQRVFPKQQLADHTNVREARTEQPCLDTIVTQKQTEFQIHFLKKRLPGPFRTNSRCTV
jgi:hypothetical protein